MGVKIVNELTLDNSEISELQANPYGTLSKSLLIMQIEQFQDALEKVILSRDHVPTEIISRTIIKEEVDEN